MSTGGLGVVLGGAECVWDDWAALKAMLGTARPVVIAVNRAGIVWPGTLDHWVTMHPEELLLQDPHHPEGIPWVAQRAANGYPAGFETWSRREAELQEGGEVSHLMRAEPDHILPKWGLVGGSGLYAAGPVATELDLRVGLCGVPMDERPHFHDAGQWEGGAWEEADLHWQGWLDVAHRLGHVRSGSGRTRELLGEWTEEWVDGVEQRTGELV